MGKSKKRGINEMDATGVIAIIMASVALLGTGVNLARVIKMTNKKPSEEGETTTISNPHHCSHEREWGKLTTTVEDIERRLSKIETKLNSHGG